MLVVIAVVAGVVLVALGVAGVVESVRNSVVPAVPAGRQVVVVGVHPDLHSQMAD